MRFLIGIVGRALTVVAIVVKLRTRHSKTKYDAGTRNDRRWYKGSKRNLNEYLIKYKVAEISGGESERPLEISGAPPPSWPPELSATMMPALPALMPRVTVGTCRHSSEDYSELNYAVV